MLVVVRLKVSEWLPTDLIFTEQELIDASTMSVYLNAGVKDTQNDGIEWHFDRMLSGDILVRFFLEPLLISSTQM
jgi:hypothetical protein